MAARIWCEVRKHPLPSVIVGTAAVSLAASKGLFLTVPADQRGELWVEIGKALTELVVVVLLLGTALSSRSGTTTRRGSTTWRMNALTSDVVDTVTSCPEYKGTAVSVRPVTDGPGAPHG